MSDVRPGPAWWQGLDGRWYPPEQRPVGWAGPGPPASPPAGAPTPVPSTASAPGPAPAPAPAPLPSPAPAPAPDAVGPGAVGPARSEARRPRAVGYGVAAAIGLGGLFLAAVLFVATLVVGGPDPERTHTIAVPGERQVQLDPGPLVFFADPYVAAVPPAIAVSGPNGDEPVTPVDPSSDLFVTTDGRQLDAVATISPSVSGTYQVTTTGPATVHPMVLAPSLVADSSLVWTALALLLGLVAVVAGVALAVVTAVRRAAWRARHPDGGEPTSVPAEAGPVRS